ncbi:GTP 3',8-cyclase MoaA [Microbacterium sp.]|uniref:GTP 3',8-cyclase MoaA n=1 Tax=Microbacterium sp. TaxID=51671 RepID=UPI0025FA0D79|nr:GTP 3',8-cyclase MoaA [Microbacterium sp.]
MSIGLGMPGIRPTIDLATRPASPALIDRFGRVATDLRVSLTDRCNLRCTYCMPADGLPWTPTADLLSPDEIARLIGIAVRELGVTSVRFTGGEPLLRADLVEIVARTAALDPRPEIALTTNGIGLEQRAVALRQAGLNRINVSLDALDDEAFTRIARRPLLRRTLAGIDAAAAAGIAPVKINAVLVSDVEVDPVELLQWALARGHELRFIEQMPLDADRSWRRADLVTAGDVRRRLSERYTLVPDSAPREGAPAQRWHVHPLGRADTAPLGAVGIIASVTEPFCGDCRRTRLTAQGTVRACLFSHDEVPLATALRTGADDDQLADLWRAAMWAKPAGHGIDRPGFAPPQRSMSEIGG